MSQDNNKTATERLEELETTVGQVIGALQPIDHMGRDLMGVKEALKLLNNKLDAVIKSLNAGVPVSDENINKYMTENNVKELADKVAAMVTQGLLLSSDTVTHDSFVVINEADPSGKVVNPRMQFLVSSLQHEEVRTKLAGAKVGSNISVGNEGASVNVLEAYNVVLPQQAAPAPAEASSTDAPASEIAPVTEIATESTTAENATVGSVAALETAAS